MGEGVRGLRLVLSQFRRHSLTHFLHHLLKREGADLIIRLRVRGEVREGDGTLIAPSYEPD